MADSGGPALRVDAVFLDRDGTINVKPPEGDYVTNASQFDFLPGAVEAVAHLNRVGVKTILVTNQRGVALGRMSMADLDGVHERMRRGLESAGAHLDAIYFCPHEKGECDCRKPQTGMFVRAREQMPGIDFGRSAVIGDSARDMEASRRIGAVGIQIAADRSASAPYGVAKVVPSLRAAVDWLLPGK